MHTLGKGRIKEALEFAGSQGRYQKYLILLFSLLWVEINFFLIGPSYIYMNPNFHCQGFQKSKVLEQDACDILQKCTLIDHFTITSDMHLYCEREIDRNFTQIVFAIGAFSGLIIINLISDLRSRKQATILAMTIANISGVCAFLGGTYQNIHLLIVSQFLGGFGAYSLIPLTYTIFSDLCSDKYRQMGVVFVNSAWGLSTVGLGLLYVFQTHWSTYLLYFVIIPTFAITVILSIFLIDSPYVLINRKQPKQALENLIKLCKFNKNQENIPSIERIFYEQDYQEEQIGSTPSIHGIYRILKQQKYLKTIVILMVIYTMATLNLYGVSYALQIEGLGYGYNSIIAGVIEMTSFLYLSIFLSYEDLLIHKIPRRCGMAAFYTIVAFLGMTFVIPGVKYNLVVASIIIGLSRVASSKFLAHILAIAYTLLACMQTQAFTVEVQSIAAASIQAFSVLGILFGPLVVDLAENIHMDPIILISIFLNFAIWPNFFLPETLYNKQKTKVIPPKESERLIKKIEVNQK